MSHSETSLEELFPGTEDSSTNGRRKKKNRGLRNTLIVLGSLIALAAIAAGILYGMFANAVGQFERVSTAQDPSLTRPAATAQEKGAVNILLLGSDSRETTDPTATADDLKGFRSDAILVAQVSPDREHVTVMSIMRDNWVEIQGHGEAKINAAVAFGGIPLAVNTVENFIGARIDHVALIDFESFKGLTDAVDGVTVNNNIAFTSSHGDFEFAEGQITLDGDEALAYVRERYAFSDGDYQRARNQQAYLKGLTQTILSADTLTDVGKMTDTFSVLQSYLIFDEDFNAQTAISLGFDMRGLRSGDITFFTSPTLGTGTSADGQSIVLPDWESLEDVQDAFANGTVHEYAAAQE